ncbi:MAG: OsmC family protein [Bacteroidia bacterium]
MFTSEVIYLGNLRTESTHVRSGNKMITDAPIDNQGKGEYFSPTDTVATALATCMITTMAIAAQGRGINLEGCRAEVMKHMASAPRRIEAIEVTVYFSPQIHYTEDEMQILEKIGRECPVARSLHPDLEQRIRFKYDG